MQENITDIFTYMHAWSGQLGQRILQDYPALHRFEDPVSPRVNAFGSLFVTNRGAQSMATLTEALKHRRSGRLQLISSSVSPPYRAFRESVPGEV